MAVLNLTSYKAIESNLFVKIVTPTETLLFCDRLTSTVINGDTYQGLGNLMSVAQSSSELRPSSSPVVVGISGIPDSNITDITNSNIKGSSISIVRGLFNATNGAFLSTITGNPIIRFTGFVNNISLNENYDVDSRESTNTLLLSCASNIEILSNKISGRRTNSSSEKKFFPDDISMDRVAALENYYFDFGSK